MNQDFIDRKLSFSSKESFQYPKHDSNQTNTSIFDSKRASEYLVSFLTQPSMYCVGIVDMVNSTKISAQLGPIKASRYYQVFLNSMAKIVSEFTGSVIKNVGDCLVYYFPDSESFNENYNFTRCIECGLAMTRSQKYISKQLVSEGLPGIDFRISSDYGSVLIMKSNVSESLDMIGPPLNMCSKINRLAGKNQFVIGGDLFQNVKKLEGYYFKEINDFSLGFRYSYPVYSVR
ncbi:Adenylate cyclase [metagenome]